jgi:deoxyribonuclease V
MDIPRPLHNWQVTAKQAVQIQKRLAGQVRIEKPNFSLQLIAGVDAAYYHELNKVIAGVIVWDVKTKEIVEQHVVVRQTTFPYVPGLLSFREAPAVVAVLRHLKKSPDVLICDGQGIAHPRRLGIASHIGVITGLSTVGCAKTKLIGDYGELGENRGDHTVLFHKKEKIGMVLRTRTRVNPVFVSVGHRMDLETAVQLILSCGNGYRLPEPTRLADQLVAKAKRRLK